MSSSVNKDGGQCLGESCRRNPIAREMRQFGAESRSVKLAMGSTIDIQLCIGRHSLRISSYEIDIQLCIQLIIRGI